MTEFPTRLYAANIHEPENPLFFEEAYRALPVWRQEKADACRQIKDRQRSIAAGLLLKSVLLDFDIELNPLMIHYNNFHKPSLYDVRDPLRKFPFFNLSHSGNWVLCALSPYPVGCDVETYRQARAASIVRRFFHPLEQEQFFRIEKEAERLRYFFRIWTGKESYLKMTGEGIGANLSDFYVSDEEGIIQSSKEVIIRSGKELPIRSSENLCENSGNTTQTAYLSYHQFSADTIGCICSPLKDFETSVIMARESSSGFMLEHGNQQKGSVKL